MRFSGKTDSDFQNTLLYLVIQYVFTYLQTQLLHFGQLCFMFQAQNRLGCSLAQLMERRETRLTEQCSGKYRTSYKFCLVFLNVF